MAHERILVVEDEQEIRELLRYNLTKEGYLVQCAASGEEAVRQARRDHPDLIVLDLMLPGMDGLEVCRTLKGDPATRAIAIVILTAKGDEPDVVSGLELGADDYVPKPFSPRVLIARIRAVLRRASSDPPPGEGAVAVDGLVVHPGRHEVLVEGRPVHLTPTEFRLLHVLAGRPGWVFTRYQLADAVHEGDSLVTDRSIDVQIVG
jgi:two-component system phosphate regulon response regulator PhoB